LATIWEIREDEVAIAYRALACTLDYLGDFENARQYALLGVQMWRSGSVQSPVEEVTSPAVSCLISESLSDWHLGEVVACHATMSEAVSVAKDLNDVNGLAVALQWAAILGRFGHNPAEVERSAFDLIELATRHHFEFWLATGTILCGWARKCEISSIFLSSAPILQTIRPSQQTGKVIVSDSDRTQNTSVEINAMR
jgi:hypothetical protein